MPFPSKPVGRKQLSGLGRMQKYKNMGAAADIRPIAKSTTRQPSKPKSILAYGGKNGGPPPKCGQRLANDMGKCDRIRGHNQAHSNAWLRKHGQP
jgi:hypothetical protein